MTNKVISAADAYKYALAHYPIFPSNWNVSEHFTWNEVFKNEKHEYGVPALLIFQNAVKQAQQMEKVRAYLGSKSINVHCWFRSLAHNLELKKAYEDAVAKHLPPPNGMPAMHSAHLYALATDFDVIGMNESDARAKEVEGVKQGKLQVRIEANTKGWVHNDSGNPYTNSYKWGIFTP